MPLTRCFALLEGTDLGKNILIVCPIAVGPAWVKQLELYRTVKLWRHQRAAAAWAAALRACMLGMDMGTGKSLAAIEATGCGDSEPLLLISKAATQVRARALTMAVARPCGTVVILNYDSVWRGALAAAVAGVKWDAIILDESHRIKSPGGRASRWLAGLAKKQPVTTRLLCLTGTPIPHSPLDFYGQMRFLCPDLFGPSFARFRARFAECDFRFPSKVRKWIRQDELAALTDPYIWRVAADDVLDLPDAIHEAIPVALSRKTAKYCADLENDMTAQIDAGTVTVVNALGQLLRMQQGTGGYARVDEQSNASQIDGTPDKAKALEDRLEDLGHDEPVVVFCRFRADLEEVAAVGRRLGRTSAELSGRMNQLAEWQDGQATILAVQVQSGGAGIDLTRAAYCFYYSLGFSLGEYEQTLARLRRPGQTRCIRYYHLIATGTVDEQVYAALRERRNVIDAVLGKLTRRETVHDE